ncbi:MAG: PHP domain-containing protein [Desulfobacterales bacterium]
MIQRPILSILSLILIIGILSGHTSAGEYLQLPGVIHVHSTVSSGKYSIGELVVRAENKGLEVLILTDHDQVVMEYGLFPLRNLIKKREERQSILTTGPENYLAEIERLNRQQQSVLIFPGVQSSPFYYWTGNPFGRGLTAHDFRKELLIVGMSDPNDYCDLPLLHGRNSTRYVKDLLARFLIFLAAFLLSIYLIYQKGCIRVCGILIAIFSLALMVDQHPFKSSRFDAYHGDQGEAPFQDVIDYARSRGGMVFWAHPESNYSKNGVEMGPVKLMTEHYPDTLIQSENYTGFAAIYGDSLTATKAGMHWDRVLLDYCSGNRAEPVWGIAGSDFHSEKDGVDLDTFQTVFLVENRGREEVLKALERGRIYAVRKNSGFRLSLDQFQIRDDETGNRATLGEEVRVGRSAVVEGRLSATDGGHYSVAVSIIRGGKPNWLFEGQTPLKFQFVDPVQWPGKTYYRLDVSGKAAGRLLSNPIFAKRVEEDF